MKQVVGRAGSESAKWQSGIFLELPVVSEQLGMLLSAGFSLGAALNRLAGRIDDRLMREMNYEVAVKKRSEADVARDFLRGEAMLRIKK